MTRLDDPERTLGGAGAARGADVLGEFANALAVGTRLHEFEILSVIGQGGFGIVYLAHDLTLARKVAIKEYMPSELATRTQAMTVVVRSDRHTETFAAGLRSFVNEARLLAQFDHPSLLKVHRFWEDHGTAYMVMPYYEGITLGKLLAQLGGPPDETRLKGLLYPLLDALELMHSAYCFHRDIAPDNILILPDGRPLLLDFGAARRVIGDMTQALTVILKQGYAPVEQYGDIPDMSQGAWTDLYALGSVVHFAITGHTPPQALTRFMEDQCQPLARAAAGHYSDEFLHAIDCTLAVLPKNRPQSVAELRSLMGARPVARAQPTAEVVAGATAVAAPVGAAAPAAPAQTHKLPPREARDTITAATTARRPPPVPVPMPVEPAPPTTMTRVAQAPGAAARAGPRTLVAGGAALLLALAAAGYAWFSPPPHELAEPAASKTPPPSPAAASAIQIATPPPLAPAAPPPPRLEETPPPLPSNPAQEGQAGAELPVPAGEAIRAAKTAAPRAPRAAAPEARPAQRSANKNLSSERCADIIHRVSIGEQPSDAEKALLKQECGK